MAGRKGSQGLVLAFELSRPQLHAVRMALLKLSELFSIAQTMAKKIGENRETAIGSKSPAPCCKQFHRGGRPLKPHPCQKVQRDHRFLQDKAHSLKQHHQYLGFFIELPYDSLSFTTPRKSSKIGSNYSPWTSATSLRSWSSWTWIWTSFRTPFNR